MANVLIGVLHADEPEITRCQASIEMQNNHDVTTHIISGLSSIPAHLRLYDFFEKHGAAYDFFIKLDADMEFLDEGGIDRISEYFLQNPNVGHATFQVLDGILERPIWGVHAFRGQPKWSRQAIYDLVDPPPALQGDRALVTMEPFIGHCRHPRPEVAFEFGRHRASKLVHRLATQGRRRHGWFQLRLLLPLFRKARQNPSAPASYAIRGMSRGLQDVQAEGDFQKRSQAGRTSEASLNDRRLRNELHFLLQTSVAVWRYRRHRMHNPGKASSH